jgi:hypothetical protein
MNNQPQRRRFWTRIVNTRRHVYYAPGNDLPGLILFGVLGIAGLAALAVGAWHLRGAARSWQDWILVIVGAALVWLAIAQIRKLWGSRA